jgi:hypothetical protein
MNEDNDFVPRPGGPRRLREILNALGDDDIPNNYHELPLYKLGYSNGQIAAKEEAKCVVRALMRMFDDVEE